MSFCGLHINKIQIYSIMLFLQARDSVPQLLYLSRCDVQSVKFAARKALSSLGNISIAIVVLRHFVFGGSKNASYAGSAFDAILPPNAVTDANNIGLAQLT